VTRSSLPPFAGGSFLVTYPSLTATNTYSADSQTVSYEIVAGEGAGARGSAEYEWSRVGSGLYVISWQEESGATVVHIDNFEAGTSQSFFTTPQLALYRMEGQLTRQVLP
jgi:phenolic acid decarboxylase